MNSQLPYWVIVCLIALSLSSCITFSPQEAQVNQIISQKQEKEVTNASKSDKIEAICAVSCQSAIISNSIRAVSADESRVWVATDKGVSM
ncbi:hypothetical protein FJZ33_07990, partial [Candidatus Poribacteria bacterium]|nr:hypothetical protein [Candidatus Poribacteria bacterium]